MTAQKVNLDQLKNIKIRNIGPAGMSGRVTAIDVDLTNDNNIFIGTASGGVWKSESGGITWQPIFDKMPIQSIGSLTINQRNPDQVWVGTGEGNPRNSHNSGGGIFKTLDGGENWKLMGLEETKVLHRIIIHRDNPDVVYAGAVGPAWGKSEHRGVYRTKDGGKTWDKILYINDETGCADLIVDPSNPNKLIAAMWEHGRKPWTFNSGGEGSGIYVSFDGGDTWKKRTDKDGLPEGILGRVGLAIAPSNPDIVYALVEAKENAFYKSTDGGFKWKKTSTDEMMGNRPFYYSDIWVDPINENRIYSSWTEISKSEDGGKHWEEFVNWSEVHPDHHAFWVHPTKPNYIIEGNDGGLNISRDRGKTWRFVENLPLAQFYHIDYDMSVPYRVCGGMQDNGSWIGPSEVWQSGGIRNHHWQEIYFGDGFDVLIRRDDPRYAYAMSQGGNMGLVDTKTGKTNFIKPVHPDGEKLRFNWNAALAQSPKHDCGIYFGSQFVHKSLDCGQTWEIISPDLTTNDTTKQKQAISGGLTIDATNAENYTTIIAIAPSLADENVIWVGTDDGNLQITKDGGKNWSNVASQLTGARPGSWIPFIEVSEKNPGEAFIIVNDYRRNDWRPMAYHTKDYGVTFKRIVDENKVTGHALSIVQDPEVPNLLFLGTDYGLFFTIDGGNIWNKWKDFPSVSTRDLKIHPREHDLIIGTFGRAAWILDDIRPLREIAKTNGKVLDKPFAIMGATDGYLSERKSVDGTRFTADAMFRGSNGNPQPMLTVWLNPDYKAPEKEETTEVKKNEKKGKKGKGNKKESMSDTKDDKDKKGDKDKKPKKVKVQIMDAAGDTIRTYSTKIDTAMTRFYWNMRHDGVRWPSRRPVKPDANMPSGYDVLPGAYKVVLTYGGLKDSTRIMVKADPRVEMSMGDRKAVQNSLKEYNKIVAIADKGWKQIEEARKTMKRVDTALANVPDSLKTEVKDLAKAIQDSLSTLEKLYMSPEKQKGIQRNPDELTSKLWPVMRYLRDSDGAPSQSAQILLRNLKTDMNAVLAKINGLMATDFKKYQEEVEKVQYSLFKEYEEIKLD
ncbi:MAG: photosystem II stability/assembly factor-like uncharacterized protein [Saprospiraceae bacterium]|jgi:photosystem II stability/assembly factor-like uncharacterized protein